MRIRESTSPIGEHFPHQCQPLLEVPDEGLGVGGFFQALHFPGSPSCGAPANRRLPVAVVNVVNLVVTLHGPLTSRYAAPFTRRTSRLTFTSRLAFGASLL